MIFGTLVKVIAGFYLGCVGTVIAPQIANVYTVQLTCRSNNGVYKTTVDLHTDVFKVISKAEYSKESNK